ncbi:50S ribosomal protein L2 [Candidatus Pacearchaeota archaeon]|nr:50S ribosomal protein L2P [uncultured archaeon]MBS3077480.1 50S ribosomal protein L2 [Candidatus Pacearchaeota archaeon]
MGKRIISQARGKGSLTYRVRKQAYNKTIGYPSSDKKGEAEIIALVHSAAHSAPLIKISINEQTFYNPAFNGAYVGQKIFLNGEAKEGNILSVGKIPLGTQVYNLERNPGDGGKMIRTAGSFATLTKKLENNSILITMPNKKTITLNENCRATIGRIAGDGRILKPFVTAGKMHYKMKAKNKLWPRTSAVKVNAVDHPFGSGRGKRIKQKIAKRNAPAGKRVGHVRPRQTGYHG